MISKSFLFLYFHHKLILTYLLLQIFIFLKNSPINGFSTLRKISFVLHINSFSICVYSKEKLEKFTETKYHSHYENIILKIKYLWIFTEIFHFEEKMPIYNTFKSANRGDTYAICILLFSFNIFKIILKLIPSKENPFIFKLCYLTLSPFRSTRTAFGNRTIKAMNVI